MAQQIFDQYAPLAKVSANETIPVVAAIAQTRDGKDELLLGNVPFVPGPGGLYVPVSASNRLPVEATLSGSIIKALRTSGSVTIEPGQTLTIFDNLPAENVARIEISVWSLASDIAMFAEHGAFFVLGTTKEGDYGANVLVFSYLTTGEGIVAASTNSLIAGNPVFGKFARVQLRLSSSSPELVTLRNVEARLYS